jgi:hypothetical protein
MQKQTLYFNILTFDYPKEEQVFYFSEHRIDRCNKIYKTQWPNEIEEILPGITEDSADFIYTTFNEEKEGFIPLPLSFSTENKDLLRKHYNRQISKFFKNKKGLLVRRGFIGENQIWVPVPELTTPEWEVYNKYSLRLQYENVSTYAELILSYDGKSKVLKQNFIEIIKKAPVIKFVNFRVNNEIVTLKQIQSRENTPEYTSCFPVLNNDIAHALNIKQDDYSKTDKYNVYRNQIKCFYANYLRQQDFKSIIPLHDSGFLKVSQSLISHVDEQTNDLKYPNGKKGRTPKTEFRFNKFRPFNELVHVFFIYHKDEEETKNKVKSYLENGLGHYPGLTRYTGILFHAEEEMNISYNNFQNPLPEVEDFLVDNYNSQPGIKHLAIYLIPFSKEETRKQEVKIYARIKELLIKRRIACQFVEPKTVEQPNEAFKWSLTTMSVSIMAKLGGVPWRLDKPEKTSLVVGVGAYKHIDGVRYVSSAFCFDNSGKFMEFDYLLADESDKLAGLIASKVKEFKNNFGNPARLVIHFYKRMSEYDIKPIENALLELRFPNSIPIFIVTVNKTYSKDVVSFEISEGSNLLMPHSGTYISIGKKKYLLFTNSRYAKDPFQVKDGLPFPVKLAIDCTDPKHLEKPGVIKELIDEVYQFSRMYWKSLTQQGLPITVSYPSMVAEVAPYFEGGVIPEEGKDNLWFL